MAGVLGFEPRNERFRAACLTAWLHPNSNTTHSTIFCLAHQVFLTIAQALINIYSSPMRVGATGRQASQTAHGNNCVQGTPGGTVQINQGPTIRLGTGIWEATPKQGQNRAHPHQPGITETVIRRRIIEEGL